MLMYIKDFTRKILNHHFLNKKILLFFLNFRDYLLFKFEISDNLYSSIKDS
ncbi:hypothetical protein MTBBW1_2470004 [Desulfamplus magnetovallimortis]|uniref:Uncharacterized protein n=1 Tax=Desulfamplus magnetovallimortis TaxID=1246637 RepID=A0A1W1HE95_9BACT|nr:hypothetical protein MTBBW1_2470004 [Desulfamplus magnetovallimortis]